MIKTNINKKSIYLLDIFVALICLAGLYQSAEKAGIQADLICHEDHLLINSVNTPFQKGDIIDVAQGHKVISPEELEFILDGHAVGDQVILSVIRNDDSLDLSVTLVRLNSWFYLFSLLLVGSIFLGLGVFVLKSRPDHDKVAVIFHWISITVCLHIVTTFGRYTIQPLFLGYFLRLIFFLASAFTPVLFIHFSFLFPREKKSHYKNWIRSLYILAIIFFAFISFYFLRAVMESSLPVFRDFMFVYNIGRYFFAACMVFGFFNFLHSYIRALEEPERRKLRWVLLGLGIGPLGFIFLWQLPQILTSSALVPEELILLISSLTPLAFAISIIRYHILDIDIIFNRSAVYFIVIAILIIIYTSIVAMAALVLGSLTVKASLIISAVAAVAVALLFEPARIRVQKFVDQKFFRIRYNYRQVQREFSQQINQVFEIKELTSSIVKKLDKLLLTDGSAICLINKDGDLELSAGINLPEPDEQLVIELYDFAERSLSPLRGVPRFIEAGIALEKADIDNFKRNKIAIALPLRTESSGNKGFLMIGPKKSRFPFTLEDIDLLKTVAAETSFAIDRIRMQKELMLKHAEAERLNELNRLKSYFVSSVSHDLQTPLTSIRMFAEILQNKPNIKDKDRVEYLDIIQGESDRLACLINNVLDYSRVERGEMKFHMERIELISLIKSVMRTMQYQLIQGKFKVETSFPKKVYLKADKTGLTSVFMNLISNAIKYSEQNKYLNISVNIKDQMVQIYIEDHGIGIPAEEQSKIFDTFYRSSEKRIQSVGGAGLGLTLVQYIIKAHNGKVELNSRPGKGTTFQIYLPWGEHP